MNPIIRTPCCGSIGAKSCVVRRRDRPAMRNRGHVRSMAHMCFAYWFTCFSSREAMDSVTTPYRVPRRRSWRFSKTIDIRSCSTDSSTTCAQLINSTGGRDDLDMAPDAELVAGLFARNGEAIFARFIGSFSLAIFTHEYRRSRAGQGPLRGQAAFLRSDPHRVGLGIGDQESLPLVRPRRIGSGRTPAGDPLSLCTRRNLD